MKIEEGKVFHQLYKTYAPSMLMEEDRQLIRDVIKIIEEQSWSKHNNDYTSIERIEKLEENVKKLWTFVY